MSVAVCKTLSRHVPEVSTLDSHDPGIIKSQTVRLTATIRNKLDFFLFVAAEWQDGMKMQYVLSIVSPYVNSISPYLARVDGVVNLVILPKYPSHSSEGCFSLF
jgi:hypothetical protein